MGLQALVLGHVGLIVGGSGEAMVADLADERLHRQVDLGVLAQVGLCGEPGAALRTHVRLGLVKRGVPPVSGLGAGQQRDGGVVWRGDGRRGETLGAVIVAESERLPCLPGHGVQAGVVGEGEAGGGRGTRHGGREHGEPGTGDRGAALNLEFVCRVCRFERLVEENSVFLVL